MKEFKKILFPVDLSESSSKLVPYVLTMAHKFDADIHLLFVVRDFAYFESIYVPHPSIMKFEEEIVEGAKKKLEEFRKECFADYPNTLLSVKAGDPAQTILHYIESERIDFLLIGTHGRKGLEKVIFGSVAERVIQKSPVPVFVVNPYTVA